MWDRTRNQKCVFKKMKHVYVVLFSSNFELLIGHLTGPLERKEILQLGSTTLSANETFHLE